MSAALLDLVRPGMISPLTLARYSALAYENLETVQAALPGAGVTFLDHEDSQAYVIEEEARTVVAFRGTQVTSNFSMGDVLANAKLRRKPMRKNRPGLGSMHRGYRGAVRALLPALNETVRPLSRNPNQPLYYTGHSLGGCVADGAQAYGPAPLLTMTFGAPKVGDKTYVNAHAHLLLIRFSYDNDIAPKHPRPWLGYAHRGTFVKIMREGKLIRRKWGWRDELIWPGSVTAGTFDHRIGEYVAKLNGAEV